MNVQSPTARGLRKLAEGTDDEDAAELLENAADRIERLVFRGLATKRVLVRLIKERDGEVILGRKKARDYADELVDEEEQQLRSD